MPVEQPALAEVRIVEHREAAGVRRRDQPGGQRSGGGAAIGQRIVLVFTLMGALCGIAGVVLTARVGAATSNAGRMMELDAIAAQETPSQGDDEA